MCKLGNTERNLVILSPLHEQNCQKMHFERCAKLPSQCIGLQGKNFAANRFGAECVLRGSHECATLAVVSLPQNQKIWAQQCAKSQFCLPLHFLRTVLLTISTTAQANSPHQKMQAAKSHCCPSQIQRSTRPKYQVAVTHSSRKGNAVDQERHRQ